MGQLTYLASPYTHRDPKVREKRYFLACEAAARLMEKGELVFSPIAHTHQIGLCMGRETEHGFWMRQDIAILRKCEQLYVLCIEGWDKSRGVNEEIHLAHRLGIPVKYLKMEEA